MADAIANAVIGDILPPPPRLTGTAADVGVLGDYMALLYRNFILEKSIVIAKDQPAINPSSGAIEAFPINAVFIAVVNTDPATLLGYGTWAAIGAGRALVGHDAADPDFAAAEQLGGNKRITLAASEMPAHTHVQDPHNHTQDPHTHVQPAHNHVQDPHTHIQPAHNHLQDPHSHTQQVQSAGVAPGVAGSVGANAANNTSVGTTDATTATNQAATATNNNATATNQAATATNNNATATNQAATATNQATGGGGSHDNVQPYIVVYFWKRTA